MTCHRESALCDGSCMACELLEHPLSPHFWGTCDHGVSLSPAAWCKACEVREDDCDA